MGAVATWVTLERLYFGLGGQALLGGDRRIRVARGWVYLVGF
ncbi:hypothetical protein [uncultured Nostoc sp.]